MPYNFQCSLQDGFAPNPRPPHPQTIGYLTDFDGLGLSTPLAKDLTVSLPYNNAPPAYKPIVPVNNQVNVTAILEDFSWNGGVSDPLLFSCYMSSHNANQLRALEQMPLRTTKITAFGWWIANYDQETKGWFEVVYPKDPVKPSGQLNALGRDIRLQIADQPTKVAPNIDVSVYHVSFEIVPIPNQMTAISLAASSTTHVVKEWGLVVGTIAKEVL
jgi:hypothetical protein